jgi:predicted CopG family antitoxin
VTTLSKYATISVPVEVKKKLEKLKGDKEWGEFLLETCTEGQRLKGKKAFEELRELLTDEDLEAIRESSKEFRENFKLRTF